MFLDADDADGGADAPADADGDAAVGRDATAEDLKTLPVSSLRGIALHTLRCLHLDDMATARLE